MVNVDQRADAAQRTYLHRVEPEVVDDEGARQLARTIRQRIEAELNYPGTIEITVIREQRYSETAV